MDRYLLETRLLSGSGPLARWLFLCPCALELMCVSGSQHSIYTYIDTGRLVWCSTYISPFESAADALLQSDPRDCGVQTRLRKRRSPPYHTLLRQPVHRNTITPVQPCIPRCFTPWHTRAYVPVGARHIAFATTTRVTIRMYLFFPSAVVRPWSSNALCTQNLTSIKHEKCNAMVYVYNEQHGKRNLCPDKIGRFFS